MIIVVTITTLIACSSAIMNTLCTSNLMANYIHCHSIVFITIITDFEYQLSMNYMMLIIAYDNCLSLSCTNFRGFVGALATPLNEA